MKKDVMNITHYTMTEFQNRFEPPLKANTARRICRYSRLIGAVKVRAHWWIPKNTGDDVIKAAIDAEFPHVKKRHAFKTKEIIVTKTAMSTEARRFAKLTFAASDMERRTKTFIQWMNDINIEWVWITVLADAVGMKRGTLNTHIANIAILTEKRPNKSIHRADIARVIGLYIEAQRRSEALVD